jgi:aconitate hydratase
MAAAHPNSFKARKTLKVGSRSYTYFSLKAVEKEVGDLSRLPFSLRVLMENLLRHEDGTTVKKNDIAAFAGWLKNGGKSTKEINFRPARVLMQDFTGVPAVVDLAAMRDAMGKPGRQRQPRSIRWCRSTSSSTIRSSSTISAPSSAFKQNVEAGIRA